MYREQEDLTMDQTPTTANPIMGILAMDATIESAETALTQVARAHQIAEQRYEMARHAWHESTSPEEHAQKVAEAETALSFAEADALTRARAQQAAIQRVIRSCTARSEREPTLIGSEQDTAARLQSTIAEDCERMSLRDLIIAVQDALDANDRPKLWLYRRYGLARTRETPTTATGYRDEAEGNARADLAALLATAKDKLRGDRGHRDDPWFRKAVKAAERADRTIKQITRRREAVALTSDGREKVPWNDDADR
jgi:hypothetical protein